ncbi:MAG: rpoN [Firmicutes bacterium]|nr:rpoN [Bacillota bacterium]
MGAMDQILHLAQQLQLSPSLLQSMKILQMNTQELGEYLTRQAEENPVLEEDPDFDRVLAWANLRASAPWLDTSAPEDLPEGISPEGTDTLPLFLRDQISRLGLAKPLEALCFYLSEMIDDKGYLLEADLEDLLDTGVPEPLLLEGVSVMQSLDPPGIAAKNLAQCLTLQLDRIPGDQSVARAMVAGHLEDLSKGHYAAIAKSLSTPMSSVQAAAAVIQGLNPRPGSAWATPEPIVYIRPDAWVVDSEEGLQLVLNQWDLPRYRLSDAYLKMLETTEDPEVRRYLQERLQKSQWLLHCVTRRESTLTRCLELLMHRQADYFTGKIPAPVPLGRYELAEELELHPSTVSRALGHKHLQCKEGIFPLSHFFPRRVGEAATPLSSLMIKAAIVRLIRQENPRHPLSDQALMLLLAQDGLSISRRTVAKYREALGLPSSFRRQSSGDSDQ